jgi:hypothetical protein
METNPPTPIARLAARQHGNVTRAQLLDLGVGEKAIQYRLRNGLLHQEHRGVYSVGRPARTALERAAAAVLACGPDAALSHQSALALWGLLIWPWRMDVTTPIDRRPPKLAAHRSRTLIRADIRTHHGIRVTTPARALLDCAPSLTRLTRAVNDALRSPYMTLAQLADVVARNPTHAGAKPLLPFVASTTGLTRSDLEDLFLAFCKRYGLPVPLINTIVCGYEVDALFAAQRVIVELDSWDFHRDRQAFENDRNRDADLLAAGFVVIRITWERLITRPADEAARLQQILAMQRT